MIITVIHKDTSYQNKTVQALMFMILTEIEEVIITIKYSAN